MDVSQKRHKIYTQRLAVPTVSHDNYCGAKIFVGLLKRPNTRQAFFEQRQFIQ